MIYKRNGGEKERETVDDIDGVVAGVAYQVDGGERDIALQNRVGHQYLGTQEGGPVTEKEFINNITHICYSSLSGCFD